MAETRIHIMKCGKTKYRLILVLVIGMLTGCVTTVDSPFTRKADPKAAVSKYVELGLAYLQKQELELANNHLSRALKIDPDSAPANAAMGLLYQEYGESDFAEAAFKKALSNDADYTQGRTYLGAFYYSKGRYKEALKQFEMASSDLNYTARAQIFSNIALCNIRLQRDDDALTAYLKTLKLDRFNSGALSGATMLLIKKGEYSRAQYYYNRLLGLIRDNDLQHSPKSLLMGIKIARHYRQTGQEKSLASVLGSLYPDSPEYQQYKVMSSNE